MSPEPQRRSPGLAAAARLLARGGPALVGGLGDPASPEPAIRE